MPKTGLPPAEWRDRLLRYAAGQFVFGRGQRPSAGTVWARELHKIDNCPRHAGGERDPFGNPLQCICSYHQKQPTKSKEDTPTASQATCTASSTSEPQPPPAKLSVLKEDTKADYMNRLPAGWENTMSAADRFWVGKMLFVGKGRLKESLQFWWHPPAVLADSSSHNVKNFFLHRLFLWMPRKMLAIDFKCPACPNKADNSLRSKGLYNRVRLVLDIRDYYYLAAEYLYCRHCSGTYIAYDSRLLSQMSDAGMSQFPILLTRKYACDRAIISILRARTLGNSPTATRNNINELHTEEYLRQQVVYLSNCVRHKKGLEALKMVVPNIEEAPPMRPVASPKWFLACYVRDVFSRMTALKAAMTSTHGSILKIDSTKKVCRKLQGKSAKSVQWATNVGNERGEILICVLTTSESISSLQDMADGLMDRYKDGKLPPPKCLYTDRECCNKDGASKYKALFSRWPELEVRLDVWHFMRRLALGCSSESHPLYGTFMSRLSSAIFEWDKSDLDRLKAAKKKEMQNSGIPQPSDSAVRKAITKHELERHCRRRTRGTKKTEEGIESLILALSGVTDTLAVPLLKDEITDIWKEQKRHVQCIQDIPGIQLYTVVGELMKGGDTLPVFRCARGSTSLESFHSHLVKFIPGTSANAVHFQAYLLDGITRWNHLRCAAALEKKEESPLRTFDLRLIERVNHLSQSLHDKPIVPISVIPSVYTGELVGVEYLYKQSGLTLPDDEELEAEIDEGFEDYQEDPETSSMPVSLLEEELPAGPVSRSDSESESDEGDDATLDEETVSVDSRGIPGWDKVDALAQALIALTGISVSSSEAENIKTLYDKLLDFDKRPIRYTTRVKKPTRGKFSRSKSGHIGVEAVKRCFLSAGSPASSPSKSRVVEAICIHLTEFSSPRKEGTYVSRWKLIVSAYNKVRQRLLNSEKLLEGTDLVLYSINETTLTRWYKDQTRRDEVKLLLQGIELPQQQHVAAESLPEPMVRPSSPAQPEQRMEFEEAEDTTGQAVRRGQGPKSIPQSSIEAQPSRTTLWRRRKASGGQVGRKVYSCNVCGNPMSSEGHTQFRGQRYCPHSPGQVPKEEWLRRKKIEAERKKKQKE